MDLADSIKRLRDGYNERCPALEMEVIDQLVELVAEMKDGLSDYMDYRDIRAVVEKADALLNKLGEV